MVTNVADHLFGSGTADALRHFAAGVSPDTVVSRGEEASATAASSQVDISDLSCMEADVPDALPLQFCHYAQYAPSGLPNEDELYDEIDQ